MKATLSGTKFASVTIIACLVVAGLAAQGVYAGAVAGVAATSLGNEELWAGASDVTSSDGSVTVEFAAITGISSRPHAVDIWATGDDFAGSYADIVAVRFDVATVNGAGKDLLLTLDTATTDWQKIVTLPGAGTVEVALSDWAPKGAGDWGNDIRSVAKLVLQVSQQSRDAETYTISNLVLVDSDGNTSDPAVLTAEQQAVLQRLFGVDSIEELSAGQLGILGAAKQTAGGVSVAFNVVEGASYKVMRSDDLTKVGGGFVEVETFAASATGVLDYLDDDPDAQAAAQLFYKVIKVD